MSTIKSIDTQKLVLLALFTAIVIILQALAALLPVYPFTLTLVLIPMVVGAALIGTFAGAWLGFVFGTVVLISGNANLFLVINPAATIFLVLLKGILAGAAAGVIYNLIAEKRKMIAVICAAIICPVVNTGIFIIGCYIFFLPTIIQWGEAAGFSNATAFIFIGMIGFNFIFELGVNLVLSPTIVRLIKYRQEKINPE